MPPTRFGIDNVVPEGVDGSGKLKRLQMQGRTWRCLHEFETKKPGLEAGQIYVGALATGPCCRMNRGPTTTAARSTHTETGGWRGVQPIDGQTPDQPRLQRIDHNPWPQIIGSWFPSRAGQGRLRLKTR